MTPLRTLLQSLAPVLRDGEWVFCSLDPTAAAEHAHAALASMREDEGTSLVLPRSHAAEVGLPDAPAFRCVTLTVHSSLEAVGLTAAVATALAARGIAANVVAATRHDHVFVPTARADEALAVLRALSDDARADTRDALTQ
jgi:hypothetical protein